MDASEIQREIAAAQRIALYLDDRVSMRAIERYLTELHTRRMFAEFGSGRAAPSPSVARRAERRGATR